jgi:O-antigen ligase
VTDFLVARFRIDPGSERRLALFLAIVGLHVLGALTFLVDVRVPIALLLTAVAVVTALERPLWGLGLLIAGRITSTGANAWVRIGRINIDLFEPSLLLCLGALMAHAALHRQNVWRDAPWRGPVVLLLAWQCVSLLWSSDPSGCLKEIAATGILLATTLAILSFARTWDGIRLLVGVWIGTSLFVALASFVGLGASETSTFEMAQGSREGGFGQHPNWFAMNLSYAVLLSAGVGLAEPRRWLRYTLLLAAAVVFIAQMQSGSRAGTGSILISAGMVAAVEPRFRRVALLATPVLAALIGLVIYFDIGDAANAFGRIFVEGSATGATLGKSVRVSNWQVCWQIFVDTWGRGIGGGGYEEILAKYDWWLYTSQYRYPHGVFWGLMAHYGAVGVAAWGGFVFAVLRMMRDLLRWTADERVEGAAELRVVALCMMGSIIGYFAWSWVEFLYFEKPFWEFLGLFTALWTLTRTRAIAAGLPT